MLEKHLVQNKESRFSPYQNSELTRNQTIATNSNWTAPSQIKSLGFSGLSLPSSNPNIAKKANKLNFIFNGRLSGLNGQDDEVAHSIVFEKVGPLNRLGLNNISNLNHFNWVIYILN